MEIIDELIKPITEKVKEWIKNHKFAAWLVAVIVLLLCIGGFFYSNQCQPTISNTDLPIEESLKDIKQIYIEVNGDSNKTATTIEGDAVVN